MAGETNRTAPNLFYTDRIKYWLRKYNTGDTYWMYKKTASMVEKHYNRLNPDGQVHKMLLPSCGKTFDLDWLSSQGVPLVVGVDLCLPVLQDVCARSDREWTATAVSKPGADFTLFERSDGKIKLYNGDMLQFSPEFEGTFDAMWERGSLIILPPTDVNKYVEVLKRLLKPGGRILLESIEFDKDTIDSSTQDLLPFPPFPYFLKDITDLFEPECTVEFLESCPEEWKYGKWTDITVYLITKKHF